MSDLNRLVRTAFAIGFALCYISGYVTGTWGILALLTAVVLSLTAYYRYCPIESYFKRKKA